MNEKRIERIIENMRKEKVSQVIITSTPDVYYVLGNKIHPGERMMALYMNDKGEKKFIVNEIVADLSEISGVELHPFKDEHNPIDILAGMVDEKAPLAVDKFWDAHFLIELMEKMPGLKPVNSKIVDEVRMQKGQDEVQRMRKAADIVDETVLEIVEYMKNHPDASEQEICDELGKGFEKRGAEGHSFEPIVAFGPNGANPHHMTDTTSRLKKGDTIIIDTGCVNDGYCSDTTRTVFFGEPSEEARKIYNIVKEANEKATAKVRPGVKMCEIDRAAREHIENAGYGEYFTHRTGHSIGMEVHESPSVSSTDETVLKEGMAFSIEPGIYIPGKLGVRIEDIVVVTADGHEVLNKTSKDLRTI